MTTKQIIEYFTANSISLTDEQAQKLEALTDFMLEYNKKVNLTRITEDSDILEKHYLDSILPLTMVNVPRGTMIADIGAGAGFPSLPMKIYRPDLEFTLVDSLGKRITYLKEVTERLGIECRIVKMRGEEAGKDKIFRQSFDTVTARAVAALNVLCEYCLPLVKKGGYFLALKGEKDETDVSEHAVSVLGGEIGKVINYTLPGGDRRNLIVIKKVKDTPIQYPRASAAIAKKPL